MTRSLFRSCGFLAVSLAMLGLCAPEAARADREGFGMRRVLVEVARAQPAKVPIPGSTIQVQGESQNSACQPVAGQLAAQLESELLRADPRLSTDDVRADAVVAVTVLRCEGEERWETRRETKTKRVGEDSDGDPIYRNYETDVRYQILDAQLVVAYKATARRSGANLDADSLESSFSEDYSEGRGAPSLAEVENRLAGEIVEQIVPRLATTSETIRVLLPKGSLKELIPIAEAGLWNKYLETLEREPQRPDSEAESYRRYAIGLAYEVLGYQTDDPETTLRYLEEAAIQYDEALSLNPGEKYFTEPFDPSWAAKAGKGVGRFLLAVAGNESAQDGAERAEAPPPIERVRSALTSYRKLISQREQLASLPAGGGAGPSGGKALAGGGGEAAFGNDQVIDMVHAGLDQAIIVQAIEDTPDCNFDVSPQGLIELSKAQVPGPVIQAMQGASCLSSLG